VWWLVLPMGWNRADDVFGNCRALRKVDYSVVSIKICLSESSNA
jgi:hypothetical protein